MASSLRPSHCGKLFPGDYLITAMPAGFATSVGLRVRRSSGSGRRIARIRNHCARSVRLGVSDSGRQAAYRDTRQQEGATNSRRYEIFFRLHGLFTSGK